MAAEYCCIGGRRTVQTERKTELPPGALLRLLCCCTRANGFLMEGASCSILPPYAKMLPNFYLKGKTKLCVRVCIFSCCCIIDQCQVGAALIAKRVEKNYSLVIFTPPSPSSSRQLRKKSGFSRLFFFKQTFF